MQVETKSLLAKLLATENLTVQNKPGIKIAMFDLRNRVLMMPLWSQEVSSDLQDLLLGHETGHALDTPLDGYVDAVTDIGKRIFGDDLTKVRENAIRGFLNVIEDARIDKRQKRRYPGLRKNYLIGYKELLDRDFFGTKGRDINGMNFIDRANLYFKGGNINLDLEFTPEERVLLKKIENMETLAEAVALTEEVFIFCKNQLEQQLSQDDLLINVRGEDGEEDSDDWGYGDDSDIDGEEGDGQGDAQGNDSDSHGQGDIQSESQSNGSGRRGAPGVDATTPQSHTDAAWEQKRESLVRDENVNYVYVNMPEINWSKAVNDYKVVLAQWKKEITGRPYNVYLMSNAKLENSRRAMMEWRMKEKESISFMVKEFEQRKAADAYIRQRQAKTGMIDTNKLHTYKFNDDIFRRITTIPKGKNHGFVMILDWSGSMSYGLSDTIKQLLSLCLFCRQIGVPFEVYAFKDSSADNPFTSLNQTNVLRLGNVVLRNFLSSRMNTEEFNFASAVLWGMANNQHMNTEGMGGTPLNEAILIVPKIVDDFRIKNKLEIVNTIFLTDGESNGVSSSLANPTDAPSARSKHFYTDKQTGKTYELDFSNWGRYLTTTFLRILKDRTQSNLVGFFLFDGTYHTLVRRYGLSQDAYGEKIKKFWNENKFYPVKNEGYDEYYIISMQGMKDTKNDLTFTEKTKTSKQMAKVFSSYAQKKIVNRVLLRQFIERIAGHSKKSA